MEGRRTKDIKLRLLFGFMMMIVIFGTLAATSLFGIKSLGKAVSSLYQHPLEVSNAALQASLGVTKMHRTMKDIAISESPETIANDIKLVAADEKAVFRNLDIIRERILGAEGSFLESDCRQLLINWKPIRQEVIELVLAGEKRAAASITRRKGALHVDKLESKMLEMTKYARGKADGFMQNAVKVESNVFATVIGLVILGAALSILIAVFTVKWVITSLSERERYEKERRKLAEKFQEAQKLESLSVLTGGIAHDFNNLLMGILGHAEYAMMDLPTKSPVRKSMERIEVTARHAADLTHQLLAYTGTGQFQLEVVDLNAIVSETMHLVQASISHKVTINPDMSADLPNIEADESQIRQVVMNLIINASEAMGGNHGSIYIQTCTTSADSDDPQSGIPSSDLPARQYVCLKISDTGQGMSSEVQNKIFDPFYTTKFTGRGLGLAATQGIVTSHKGAIGVESTEGEGSTFTILLPSTEKLLKQEHTPPLEATQIYGEVTILVVDDDQDVLELCDKLLSRSGFHVFTATEGEKGVDVYRKHQDDIDLVVLDMMMPGMDGAETFQQLRNIRSDVKVILSSGYSEKEVANRMDRKSLAGYLRKPYRSVTLKEKIYDIMKGS